MVLVSQPTHPAFHDSDIRQQKCNVCNADFTCPPPTRHELMQSFTGAELAALIDPGSIIGAHEAFTAELERQIATLPGITQGAMSLQHWVRGVYLITEVQTEDGHVVLPITGQRELNTFREKLRQQDYQLSVQGKTYRLVAGGSLAGAADPAGLPEALAAAEAPAELHLATVEPPTCGDDHIAAVNLTRPLGAPRSAQKVQAAMEAVLEKFPAAAKVDITHFNGGPCETHKIVSCVVLGGTGQGWTLVKSLEEAVELAHSRAVKRSEAQGDVAGGQAVEITGLKARPDLNGTKGLCLRFHEPTGRWLVRLPDGQGFQLKPQNLTPLDGARGKVFCFWGDARWTRAQLLGEIARGSWGLCKGSVSDLITHHDERRENLNGRLVYAPVTEMTDSFVTEAAREMEHARALHQAHAEEDREEES